jgi:serine/threonine protein kinase
MDITEVRHRFAAYGSGELTQSELRDIIRTALTREPLLSTAYIALSEAYRRARVIDAELHSTIVADIREITGPRLNPALSPADNPERNATTVFFERPAAPVEAGASPQGEHPSHDARAPEPERNAIPADAAANDGDVVPSEAAVYAGDGFAGASAPPPGPAEPGTGDPSWRATTGMGVAGGAGAATSTGMTSGTGPTTGTTGTGSAWDSPERLAEAATPLFSGSVLNGRFQLIEELGRGGMGVVYKALDLQTTDQDRQRYVAIKVLNDDFKRHPLAVRSLQREARKAQKLAHPNIVTVHDFDRDAGNVYMELELLTGRSLDQVLRTEAKVGLPLPRVMAIVKSLGAALSHAHEQGIVHSDFKPSNAFITDDGTVKVLDFGIARAAPNRVDRGDKTLFDAGQLGAISPPYASPEMLNGEAPDVRDDIYGLACVTYQLLTGRHPFNRIDAVKAREAGLQPPPVRSLTRSRWRALRQGLAFERGDRTPTVDHFVTRFTEPPRHSTWWAVAASIAVVAIAVAVVVTRQWGAHEATVLQHQLAVTDPAAFDAALTQLRAAPPRLRRRVLLDEATKTAVLGHFQAEMRQATAPPKYDYGRAHAIVGELRTLLPDSSLVITTAQQLDRDQQSELAQQLESRDKFLRAGPLVASQGPDNLTAALGRIQLIDPQHGALSDPRLPSVYATAAATAVDTGRADLGKEIVTAGLTFAPNDAKLLGLQDRIGSELQRVANARRASELEQRLATLNPASAAYLDAVLANRDDLSSLAAIAPASPVLARVQSSLQTTVLARIKQQLADHDIAGARDLLLNVGELLPEQTLATARASVLEAAGAEQDRALDTLDRLRSAALTGRLEQTSASGALDLYAELQRAGASPDVLAEARDLLAYGYLRQARRARAAGDTQSALKSLAAGRALQASSTLQLRLAAEQAAVTAPPSAGGDQTQGAGTELNAARGHFGETLRSSALGSVELAAMADALDRLEALGASPREADSGLRQIEDRVIGEIGPLQQQSGPDRAQLFAHQAAATVLGSVRIAEVARQLRHSAVRKEARYSPETLAQRNELSDLVARPEATPRWAASVHKLLQRLAVVLPADDAALADARRVAVNLFVRAAADARTNKDAKEAKNFLEEARSFDAQSLEIARENAAVERDRSATEAQAADHAQQAGIDSLKSKLAAQVAAGNMDGPDGAIATSNALRRVLGGSVYVARDMPQILVGGYVHRARTQLATGHVDEALETLASARKKFGAAPELKNLETRYVAIGDVFDRLSTAILLNADELRHGLDGLRGTEGVDYPAIEGMLAHTLANRIADQRAAKRASVVASLVEAGHKLFPEYATVLEQGIAGALPKTGLAVTTDP